MSNLSIYATSFSPPNLSKWLWTFSKTEKTNFTNYNTVYLWYLHFWHVIFEWKLETILKKGFNLILLEVIWRQHGSANDWAKNIRGAKISRNKKPTSHAKCFCWSISWQRSSIWANVKSIRIMVQVWIEMRATPVEREQLEPKTTSMLLEISWWTIPKKLAREEIASV